MLRLQAIQTDQTEQPSLALELDSELRPYPAGPAFPSLANSISVNQRRSAILVQSLRDCGLAQGNAESGAEAVVRGQTAPGLNLKGPFRCECRCKVRWLDGNHRAGYEQ